MPFPRAFDDFLEGLKTRLPSELPRDLCGGRNEARGIARPARLCHGDDFHAGDFLTGFNHLSHTFAASGAQIVGATFGGAEGEQVGLRKIEDMDVVTNARAIGRVVVCSVNFDALLLTESNLQNVRDKVRLDTVIFTKALAGTGGVEIAQGDIFHSMNGVVTSEGFFQTEIWIRRMG